MDAYKCAYRDPKSPLTPITPMTQSPFNFDFNSLQAMNRIKTPVARPRVKRFQKSGIESNRSPCSIKISAPADPYAYRRPSTPVESSPRMKDCRSPLERHRADLARVMAKKEKNKAKNFLSPSGHKPKSSQRHFLKASPVAKRGLSPRVSKVLADIGQSKYHGLFQREEIDMTAFAMMNECDLRSLGISEDDVQFLFKASQNFQYCFAGC